MLQTQKLLQISSKPSQQKPAYIKPKHKSYRQLLGLDKPKKKIYLESDDDNDDFLQKLLRQQENDKKKKKKNKTKVNKKQKKNDQNIQKQKIQVNKEQQKNNKDKLPNKNDNNDKFIKQRQNKRDFNKVSINNSPEKQKEIIKEGQMRMWKRMESARKQLKTPVTGRIVSASKGTKKSGSNNQIMINQEQQQPYKIVHALKKQSHIHSRSQKGLKVLKDMKEKQIIGGHKKIALGVAYNPQLDLITHNPIEQQQYCFKAKVLSTKQILSMTSNFRINTKKTTYIKEQCLFKSAKQEEIFLKNLKEPKKSMIDFKQFI